MYAVVLVALLNAAPALAGEPDPSTPSARVWTPHDYSARLLDLNSRAITVVRELCGRPLGSAEELAQLRQDADSVLAEGRIEVLGLPDWHNDGSLRDVALATYVWAQSAVDHDFEEMHRLVTMPDVRGADVDHYEALLRALLAGVDTADLRMRDAYDHFEAGRGGELAPPPPAAAAPADGVVLTSQVLESFTLRYREGMRQDHEALIAHVLPTLDAATWLGPENEATRRQAVLDLVSIRAHIRDRGAWRGDATLLDAELSAADALITAMGRPGATITHIMKDMHLYWWEQPIYYRAVSHFDRALDLADGLPERVWAPFDARWGLGPAVPVAQVAGR